MLYMSSYSRSWMNLPLSCGIFQPRICLVKSFNLASVLWNLSALRLSCEFFTAAASFRVEFGAESRKNGALELSEGLVAGFWISEWRSRVDEECMQGIVRVDSVPARRVKLIWVDICWLMWRCGRCRCTIRVLKCGVGGCACCVRCLRGVGEQALMSFGFRWR